MLCGAVHAIRNRLPGGIEYKSLWKSLALYKDCKSDSFYKAQFLHNLKAYFLPSHRYSSMDYERSSKSVPAVLYHVTDAENKRSILKNGLVGGHNPVVFMTSSESYVNFLKSKYQQHGCTVFKIEAEKMENDGYAFFNSIQKERTVIWVTEFVPPGYIKEVDSEG